MIIAQERGFSFPVHRFENHGPQQITRKRIKDPLWKDQPKKEQDPAEPSACIVRAQTITA